MSHQYQVNYVLKGGTMKKSISVALYIENGLECRHSWAQCLKSFLCQFRILFYSIMADIRNEEPLEQKILKVLF